MARAANLREGMFARLIQPYEGKLKHARGKKEVFAGGAGRKKGNWFGTRFLGLSTKGGYWTQMSKEGQGVPTGWREKLAGHHLS